MRIRDERKFKLIADEMKRFFIKHERMPSQKELSKTIGLTKSSIHYYLKAMKEMGIVVGSGREITTRETKLMSIPVVDSLFNSSHTYDNATINDFVFVSHKIYGEGKIGMIRAVDNSMEFGSIVPNSFIIIRRQDDAEIGQIVLVKASGKFYLRRLIYDKKTNKRRIKSESSTYYEEIIEYEIRGVALSVITHFDADIIERCLQQLIQPKS